MNSHAASTRLSFPERHGRVATRSVVPESRRSVFDFQTACKQPIFLKEYSFKQISGYRVLGSLESVVDIVVIDVVVDWLSDLDKEFVVVARRVVTSIVIAIVAHMLIWITRLADAVGSSLPRVNRKIAFAGCITVGAFIVDSTAGILLVSLPHLVQCRQCY